MKLQYKLRTMNCITLHFSDTYLANRTLDWICLNEWCRCENSLGFFICLRRKEISHACYIKVHLWINEVKKKDSSFKSTMGSIFLNLELGLLMVAIYNIFVSNLWYHEESSYSKVCLYTILTTFTYVVKINSLSYQDTLHIHDV